jgi:hypothetical protein
MFQKLSRRDLLKLLAASAGAAVISTVPNKWVTPIVEIGALPAHAQASQRGTITGSITLIQGTDSPIQTNAPTLILTVGTTSPYVVAGVIGTGAPSNGSIVFPYSISNLLPANNYVVRAAGSICAYSGDISNVVVTAGSTTPNINFVFNCNAPCLSSETLISTPADDVRITDIKIGMSIWTLDAVGKRVPSVVLRTQRIPVPSGSSTMHLILSDGREAFVSGAHPLTDGRLVQDLLVGDCVDGAWVAQIVSVPYAEPAKYDVLAAGETGAYWANGIPMNSTITPLEQSQHLVTDRMSA